MSLPESLKTTRVGDAVAVQVSQRVQHFSYHVPGGECGEPVRVECHIGHEGSGLRCKQPALVLEMNLEVVPVPEHKVGATISVIVDFIDTALRPRVIPISVGSEDSFHFSGRTEFHWISERAVAHLDEHRESI